MDNSGRIVVSANVGRAGLGNMLLPWARAEVFAKVHGLRMLAPQWVQPKIGPLLRREKDLRYYTGLFSSRGYVRGVEKILIRLRSRRIDEADAERAVADQQSSARMLIVFKGMEGDFEPLYAHKEFVSRRLMEILSSRCKKLLAESDNLPFIGVHVRCGDKAPLEFGKPYPVPNSGSRLPLKWFANCICNIRSVTGSSTPVRIFSDAPESELKSLTDLGNVSVAAPNPSIVDILLMARSKVLITTGSSSFSMWAAFLGGMPAVWYPQSSFWAPTFRQRLAGNSPDSQPETSLEGDLPKEFIPVLAAWMK